MAFSTKQLADLAGSTVNTVRHYHDIGLLDVPDRWSNGYKKYTVTHLVRLLQIKRLSELGVGLADIATNGVDDDLARIISELDADVAGKIERLDEIRTELKAILLDHAPVDVPAEFSGVARNLSDADRALIMVFSRVLSVDNLIDLREALTNREPIFDEFDALPPDADDDTVRDLTERYRPIIRRQLARYPWMLRPFAFGPAGEALAHNLVRQAISALYNPAQQAVGTLLVAMMEQEAAVESAEASSILGGTV